MSNQITNKLLSNNVPYFSGTNGYPHEHLLSLLNSASKEIIFFGLTCSFYLSEHIKEIIIRKSQQITITIIKTIIFTEESKILLKKMGELPNRPNAIPLFFTYTMFRKPKTDM